MIDIDGLHPISKGARITFQGGKPHVIDGPFIETKEVIGGYWIFEMDSQEEALEWARRVPAEPGDVIELRINPISQALASSMKFICLGYIEANKFENMSETERNAMVDECFSYDDELRKNGHFAGGEGLQPPQTAATLRWEKGKVFITDGPFIETKEVIGGILILEARDMDHAIELMSKHPGVKAGPFEIRPAADLSEMMRESEARRGKA
jgi:hypothetical protein